MEKLRTFGARHYAAGLDVLGASGPDVATALAMQKDLQKSPPGDTPLWQWALIIGGVAVGMRVVGKVL